MIASVMNAANQEILKSIVAETARRYNPAEGVLFVSSWFATAIQGAFDLKAEPSWEWCNDVLAKLAYVRPLAALGFWAFDPTK